MRGRRVRDGSTSTFALMLALTISSTIGLLTLVPNASAVTTLALVSPRGGELWTGGAIQDVVWDLGTDSNNNVDVVYLVDGVPAPIEYRTFVLMGRYITRWTPPVQDLANVTIRVCATDAVPVACDGSAAFRIDGTPPALKDRSPDAGNVGLAEPIFLNFTEEIDATTLPAAVSIRPDPGNLTFGTTVRNGTRVDHGPLAAGTRYAVSIGCAVTDRSAPGHPLAGCPINWTFTTDSAPAFAFGSPAGGEVWSGSSTHAIRWIAADAEDPLPSLRVYLEASIDGISYAPAAGPLAGDASYLWTLPVVDTATARIRGRVVDTRGMEAEGTSSAFIIDAVAPTVVAVTPADGTPGVPWDAPITVTFDEPMAGPLSLGVFSVRSAAGPYVPGSLTWDSPQRFRFSPSVPYRPMTAYVAVVNATVRDRSDPGNPVAAPASWRFVTRPNDAPRIRLDFTAAAVLSGGSAWDVSWTAADPYEDPTRLQVFLEFSDGGAFQRVAGPLPAAGTYTWTAPARDVAVAALLVRVVDSQGTVATDAALFAIDGTPPRIVAANPGPGGPAVPPDAVLRMELSEPLDPSTVSVGLRDAATGAWTTLAVSWDDPRTARFAPASLLREGAAYEVVVNGTARDLSSPGNRLPYSTWAFTVQSFPPIVAVLEPPPAARWSAGSRHVVRVLASDALDPSVILAVDFSIDGTSFVPLRAASSVASGETTISVLAPGIDAPGGIVRACATDRSGATACATASVAIDARPPTLASSSPGFGARRVRPDARIVLTFSEPMDAASVEAAFSLSPVTPLTFRWERTAAENDTIVAESAGLVELRAYTVTLACTAKDGSDPGLEMRGTCPLAWTFVTAARPEVRMLAPLGGERFSGGSNRQVRWITASEENALHARAELSIDGGTTFDALAAVQVTAVGEGRLDVRWPTVDAEAAVLRVTVRDSLGLTATVTSERFAIDATPPRVLAIAPADGAAEASPLEDVVIVFTESMDPSSESALAVTPRLRDPLAGWSTTRVPFDTLRISHAAIRLGTTVRIALAGMRDASIPGNVVGDSAAFRVAPDREAPQPSMAVREDAREGDIVVLDASASTDNDEIVDYAWFVRDARGTVVSILNGARVEYRVPAAGVLHVTVQVTDAAGNRGDASALVRVRAAGTTVGGGGIVLPGNVVYLLDLFAMAGTAGATVYGWTDRGRSFLARVVFLPLHVRTTGPGVANHEVRGMIRGYILVHPGDCYTDLRRNLRLANGELAYHLAVLEREGLIRSVVRGPRHAFYPAGALPPEDGGGLHEVQARILRNVAEVPGMTIRDLAGLLGLTPQLTHYHLRRLRASGWVRFERRKIRTTVFRTSEEERAAFVQASAEP